VSRAPFQVLVLPFRVEDDGQVSYAVFRRADAGYWQWIAGGGEDDESPVEAAKREADEEAGIGRSCPLVELSSCNTVPVEGISGFLWGSDVLVVPEHCFGIEAQHRELRLSQEHTEFRWVDYETARQMLHWDSNRNALWELNHRLTV
jgi:dihydroneopterin triphosphate diphosphatase